MKIAARSGVVCPAVRIVEGVVVNYEFDGTIQIIAGHIFARKKPPCWSTLNPFTRALSTGVKLEETKNRIEQKKI